MSAFVTDFPQLCWEISTPTKFQNLCKQILLFLYSYFSTILQTRTIDTDYLTGCIPLIRTQSLKPVGNEGTQHLPGGAQYITELWFYRIATCKGIGKQKDEVTASKPEQVDNGRKPL